MKNAPFFILLCSQILLLQGLFGQKTITTASLLHDLANYTALTKWPHPYFQELQASSYDRRSVAPGQPGWFANNDASQFVRIDIKDNRKEYVMLDTGGPGAIIRFWITTFKREGTLRIYFDNQPDPEITIPAYDLMKIPLSLGEGLLLPHSSYEPKEKGGSTLYLPMPFSRHCKITWQEMDTISKEPRYYQINYRKYEAGTQVQTFSTKEFNKAKELANKTNNLLLHPVDKDNGKHSSIQERIEPGKRILLSLPAGANAIKLLRIKISTTDNKKYEKSLHSTLLKITFDGDQTVLCPLDVFSGSGIGGKELQSWYRTVSNNGTIISRWVMPYQHLSTISIENSGNKEVKINLDVVTSPNKWDNNTLYFHADWKEEKGIAVKKSETDNVKEWNFNSIKGRGIFAGETFSVYNHMHYWYGEGDQKIWIDRDTFPSEYSTGTEDYYNTSWAPVVLYQTPFANAPRADNKDSYGANTFTRTRNLDVMPFKNNFSYTLEMLGWENGTIDASVVTYWYGFKGSKGKQ